MVVGLDQALVLAADQEVVPVVAVDLDQALIAVLGADLASALMTNGNFRKKHAMEKMKAQRVPGQALYMEFKMELVKENT